MRMKEKDIEELGKLFFSINQRKIIHKKQPKYLQYIYKDILNIGHAIDWKIHIRPHTLANY